ncbi:MAG: PRTRC system protein C [Reichenbachiella sp.]|uniref:PRTRC system protein C n=1 Tax=Reichenbachiella sp. TaxID=2184521 RepID=UPI0032665374
MNNINELVAQQLTRQFIIKDRSKKEIILDDPNPSFNAQQVLEHYSRPYPQLAVAKVPSKPKLEDDKMIYVFETTVGTKG